MRRVALDLDRPPVDVTNQDAVGIATDNTGRGEQVAAGRNRIGGRQDRRDQHAARGTVVASAQTGQGQARRHQLQHPAPVPRRRKGGGKLRKLGRGARDECRVTRQPVETAPLTAQRWHIEQSVRLRPPTWYCCGQRGRGRCVRRAMPVGVVDRLRRSQVGGGIAMAVEAEPHRQGPRLLAQRHVLHGAVAALAADALGDVDLVIEVDIVGKIGDAMPGDRGVVREAFAHRCQHGGVGPDLRMTGHAGVGRRHARVRLQSPRSCGRTGSRYPGRPRDADG